ncbi:RNA recognition motif (RRM, RBD, or RNP domain) [Novymonas esmeraldas]|uniref:RNA recognition motif (RRM, RBD, or RNP domain) n=1 Tax=Novymonas esmeraldas TaxID=1808958 RepID=A0AAW0F5Y1_9TRYP
MASFTPLESFKSRGRGMMPTGIVIDKSCRVYVTHIPLERIERDGATAMKAEFEVYGPLESYKMFTDRSGRFVGSALCTYRNPADASMAVYCMDGVEVEGSMLHVEPAKEHGVVLLSSGSGSGGRRDHSHGFLRDTQRQWGRGGGAGLQRAGRGLGVASAGGDGAVGTGGAVLPQHHGDAEGDRTGDGDTGAEPSPDDGKWNHDKYHMMAAGKDMDEVLGIRRPAHQQRSGLRGRGGRSGPRNSDHVDAAFERYIRDRDASSEDFLRPSPPVYTPAAPSLSFGADLQPTSTASTVAEAETHATAVMPEMAFGADESTAPITGHELGESPRKEDAAEEERTPLA